MTSSNMVLRKTASYFRLAIRGHGDSHFQIGQLRLLRRRCIVLFNILKAFFSRIDEHHWLLPSPIRSESSHCYLRTSIQATIDLFRGACAVKGNVQVAGHVKPAPFSRRDVTSGDVDGSLFHIKI